MSLGTRSFDTATRALVMGVACCDGSDHGRRLLADGADVLDQPSSPGASFRFLSLAEVDHAALDAAARTGASVVLSAPAPAEGGELCERLRSCARAAEAAGLTPDRIVVSPGAHHSAHVLRGAPQMAALGYPLLIDLEPWPDDEFLGAASLAIIGGARLLRTRHVKSARRIADTIAAVLEAA